MKAMTWDEAVTRWQKEKPWQPSDKGDFYRVQRLNKHLKGRRLSEIDLDLIQDTQQELLKELAPSTVNRHMVILRVILKTAYRRWKVLPGQVQVPVLKEEETAVRFLEPEEIQRLLAAMTPLYRDMCLFALATGLRSSNVSLCEWSWIDMKRSVATIPSARYKSRRIHSIPLNEVAMDVLKRRQGLNGTYVFSYPDGRIIRSWGKKTFRDAVAKAGLHNVHPHVLRHTFASGNAMAGTDLKTLMELGGWKSEKLALRYIHLNKEHLRQASNTIVGWIRPQVALDQSAVSATGDFEGSKVTREAATCEVVETACNRKSVLVQGNPWQGRALPTELHPLGDQNQDTNQRFVVNQYQTVSVTYGSLESESSKQNKRK